MSESSNIGWTDSTASPWFVCTEVSPGCAHCYARQLTEQKFAFVGATPQTSGAIRRAYWRAGLEDWATRPVWGKTAPRVLTKGFWGQVPRWDRQAAKAGVRRKVFPSLMDWLDDFPAGVMDQDGRWLAEGEALAMFLDVVRRTPNTDWLLLTKRIEDFKVRVERQASDWLEKYGRGENAEQTFHWLECEWFDGKPPANIWLGVSVENQRIADERIPKLLKIPAEISFLSVEPLLQEVNLLAVNSTAWPQLKGRPSLWGIDWVIVGGESGADRRDCGVDAIVSVRDQCKAAVVPCFVKQDCHRQPGQQGRLPDSVWNTKEWPK